MNNNDNPNYDNERTIQHDQGTKVEQMKPLKNVYSIQRFIDMLQSSTREEAHSILEEYRKGVFEVEER